MRMRGNRNKGLYQIPIAFIRKEFDCKSAGVTSRIGRAFLSTDRREANENGGFLADFAKEICIGQVGNIICDLEDTVRPGTLGMDNTLSSVV
jgi:hypothetical protein